MSELDWCDGEVRNEKIRRKNSGHLLKVTKGCVEQTMVGTYERTIK